MSEILRKELKKNKDKKVKIFLKNGFFYCGKILDIDDSFLRIDDVRKGEQLLAITSLERVEVQQ